MADPAMVMDEKLKHAIELREHRLHAAGVPPPVAAKESDPEGAIVLAFELVAGLWATAAGLLAVLALLDLAPRSVTDNRTTVHLAIALAASAASALSALLYAIPGRIGATMWSRGLPWLHAVLLNAAFVLPAWKWHSTALLHTSDWTGTLVATILLHLGWLAALALNLGESFAPLMARPRSVLAQLPPDISAPPAPSRRPAPALPGPGHHPVVHSYPMNPKGDHA